MKAPVAIVFGTRPEAVKMAPVAKGLSELGVPARIVVTAQHRGLLDQMLAVFGLKADVDLDLMRHDQKLGDFGARALAALGDLFRRDRPSMVLVQGDTSTVFFAALAAFYEGVPVGHVEAGLRSHDLARPFPEEANRRLTAQLSTLHFAPTEGAARNLLAEGISGGRVFVTGNTVVDSLRFMSARAAERKPADRKLAGILEGGRPIVLVTVHRRESFGEPLLRIFAAIDDIARARPDVDIVYPVHPNPAVAEPAAERLSGRSNIHLLPPLDYLDFVAVMSRSVLCLTDSGGVQEEAPSLGLPVLVLREKTERPEGLAAGWACLVGSDRALIVSKAVELLSASAGPAGENPYGDGRAGLRIAGLVRDFLDGNLAWEDEPPACLAHRPADAPAG